MTESERIISEGRIPKEFFEEEKTMGSVVRHVAQN